ncbi:MAG: M28 family peptidase [Acidobacteriaceae bacterium]|nr:M28 family peptidase [Acidobacteriaceae bacterium]
MAHPPANVAEQPAESASAAPEQISPVPAPKIDANRAMGYVRDVVAFGPRPVGSAAHKKTEAYIVAHLKGAQVVSDEFKADTPAGKLPMRNIIAKFPGAKPGVIVIATHYDTLYGRNDFVGANDGGSGTGLLLELVNQLRGPGRPGYSVWLVWLDGEEAIREWTETDSVYGSRHLAAKWQQDGTIKQIKAFLLADMIGDADLSIDREKNSAPWLEDLVYQAATALGFQSHFFRRGLPIEDDHIPFAQAGVPVADLIDFDYGYANSYWHTPADTIDKLSPRSLEIVGNVLLETTAMLDRR